LIRITSRVDVDIHDTTTKKYKQQERKVFSVSRSLYTLPGRYRGSIVCAELSDFRKTKNFLKKCEDNVPF